MDAQTGELLFQDEKTIFFDYDLSDAHGHSALHDCYYFTPQDRDIGDETGIFDDDYLNDPDAVENWQFGHDVYWYYAQRFNRSGYDGNDFELEMHIHTNILENEGWLGAYHPSCGCIDIANDHRDYYTVAHEYTHGVVDFTSDLKWSGQPGALDEFFAYIMGSLAEYHKEGYSGEFQALGDLPSGPYG